MEKEIVSKWVGEYGDDLYSWAFYKTSSRETAQDLIQETFLSAFKSYKTFKHESQPKTWLFKILNNKIIDYYRKSANTLKGVDLKDEEAHERMVNKLFDQNDNWEPTGFEQSWEDDQHLLDNPEFNEIMDGCLNDLPSAWRFAVTAKYHLEKEPKDICQELNITPSNYWQIIHRAKLLLKKCIEIKWSV
jgi:RNA polymerase sigma-70 factor (ECF subfamily)